MGISHLHTNPNRHSWLARILMAEDSLQPASERSGRRRQRPRRKTVRKCDRDSIAQTLAYQAQGDTSAALAALERALTHAEPEGYIRIYVDEGEVLRLLMADFRLLIEKREQREDQKLIGYAP